MWHNIVATLSLFHALCDNNIVSEEYLQLKLRGGNTLRCTFIGGGRGGGGDGLEA